jgi:hypothetical protein
LKAAESALEGGKWEESASMIEQARLLFERGGASAKEQGLADQLHAKLLQAKEAHEARTRGLGALAAGTIFCSNLEYHVFL